MQHYASVIDMASIPWGIHTEDQKTWLVRKNYQDWAREKSLRAALAVILRDGTWHEIQMQRKKEEIAS